MNHMQQLNPCLALKLTKICFHCEHMRYHAASECAVSLSVSIAIAQMWRRLCKLINASHRFSRLDRTTATFSLFLTSSLFVSAKVSRISDGTFGESGQAAGSAKTS